MSKIGIVIERECLTRIRKKSFIFLTLLMPLLIVAIVALPTFLASIGSDEKINVAVQDATGQYMPLLTDTGRLHFAEIQNLTAEDKGKDSKFDAYIVISEDLNENPQAATIYSHKEVPMEVSDHFNRVVEKKLRNQRISEYQIADLEDIMKKCNVDFSVRTVKWADDGSETLSSSMVASVVGILFTTLIYMFILIYGSMVMQGVTEEKTNRIMEIMVSSVKPFELMMGKIIGIALVGLIQTLLWGGLIALIIFGISLAAGGSAPDVSTVAADVAASSQMAVGEMAKDNGAFSEVLQIINGLNLVELFVMFILYFIGGYLLYASLFAAIGASVNETQDTSQFMSPITILLVFGMYAGMFSAQNPDGPLAMWCSFIPLTSPVVMMVRLPFGVPVWQTILSLALLFATAFAVIWLSAKIYRVGILMYGKKPTYKDLARWLKLN